MNENPRYTHYCNDCLFLGFWGSYDLYFCLGEDAEPVARYGNERHHFLTKTQHVAMQEAERRMFDRILVGGYPCAQ